MIEQPSTRALVRKMTAHNDQGGPWSVRAVSTRSVRAWLALSRSEANWAKAARASELGADLAVDVADGDWAAAVKAAGNVDVVLDMVGAEYFERNLDVLAPDGRLVVIATLTGHEVRLDLRRLMLKRLTVSASTLRARDAVEKARLARAIEEQVWPWIAAGTVDVPVDRTFPLERAAEAHAWLESGSQFGKVVLTVE